MHTLQRIGRGPCAAAALVLLSGWTQAGDGWQQRPARAPAAPHAPAPRCQAATEAAPPPRDDGGADIAGQSAHLRAVLGGGDSGDIDALHSPCRLVNGEVIGGARINDGVDLADLLRQIAALLELNNFPQALQEDEPFDEGASTLRLAIGATDQRWHAYWAAALRRDDPGAWDERARRAGLEHAVAAGFGATPHAWPAAGLPRGALEHATGGPGGALSPVPEAATWTMLLAGLGLLGWRAATPASRRVSGGKARPAPRR